MLLAFDPGEPAAQRKHAPRASHATWALLAGAVRTFCAQGITHAIAEASLNSPERFEAGERSANGEPAFIYVMHDGVLYRLVPTGMLGCGRYHGFPETMKGLADKLTEKEQRALLSWAEQHGHRRALASWLRSTKDWTR